MDISVIIVNYNVGKELGACVESLLMQTDIEFEIIVVDNNSMESSLAQLEKYSEQLTLVKNKKNVGFGAANNIGFQHAAGKYIYLMNPDAFFKEPDALKKIFEFAKAHPVYGLIGTRVVNEDGAKETRPNRFYPGEARIGFPFKQLPGEIAWVLGASMLIPRKVYDAIHGFDEQFFLYGEDPDICLRIRKRGYEIGYYTGVTLYHIGAVTEKKSSWYERTLKKQRALLQFYQKHYQPDAVQFLLRHDLCRARRKYYLNRLKSFFTFGLLHRDKDEKQKAIYNFCREHLS